jgi:catechol 2,3-dioxygenase-like lactoylglutathione lyase family enzyme
VVKGIAVVAYAVGDVPRSVAFYRDVVGLEPGELSNDEYFEFSAGETAFAVDASPPGYEPGTCNGVSFEVDDIVAARQRLMQHDVPVTEIYEFPTCSACFAKDPDGNGFALHLRK